MDFLIRVNAVKLVLGEERGFEGGGERGSTSPKRKESL
jgi:hypothetical protein